MHVLNRVHVASTSIFVFFPNDCIEGALRPLVLLVNVERVRFFESACGAHNSRFTYVRLLNNLLLLDAWISQTADRVIDGSLVRLNLIDSEKLLAAICQLFILRHADINRETCIFYGDDSLLGQGIARGPSHFNKVSSNDGSNDDTDADLPGSDRHFVA